MDGGRIGSADRPTVNRGSIVGGTAFGNFRPVIAGSSLTNLGTIEARDGCIAFGGTFTRDDLGTLVWGPGGTFGIAGTLLNHNSTFVVDSAHPWELNDGTIRGGTLQIEPGAELRLILPYGGTYYGGTLDDVIVHGRISHFGAAPLNIANGVLAGDAEIFLGPRPIEGPPRLVSSSPTLTINSSVLVHGGGGGFTIPGYASGIGDGSGAIVNHGTIRAESSVFPPPSDFDLLGTSIFNDGVLSVSRASFIYAAQGPNLPTTLTFGGGGVLELDRRAFNSTTPLLQVNGQLDLTTSGDNIIFTNSTFEPSDFVRIVSTTGGVLGQFDFVTPGFEVMYSGNDIFARVIPEPGSFALGAGAAGALLRCRRLRRKRGVVARRVFTPG